MGLRFSGRGDPVYSVQRAWHTENNRPVILTELNVLLRRLQSGEDVTYGEVDFSQFAADDLRTLDGYLKQHENMGFRLSRLIGNVDNAAPYCCALSAFC